MSSVPRGEEPDQAGRPRSHSPVVMRVSGPKRKILSERPTRPRVLQGESPRALNCPVRRASMSDAREGNDPCSART